jgi:hypothetical protein
VRPIILDHLYRLTDNTGIRQHARGARSNPDLGYRLDDNARALIAAIRAHARTGDNGLLDYIRHYLAFVERCQRPDGRFRGVMAADGAWLDELASDDGHGRAISALGFAARRSAQTEVRVRALRCLDATLGWLRAGDFPPRMAAFTLLGLDSWRAAEPSDELEILFERLSAGLAEAYRAHAAPDWRWFADELTSNSAALPEALLATRHREIGLEALAWLCSVVEVDGRFSLVGDRGWYRRGGVRAVFDQRPVDAGALVSACVAAYRAGAGERFRRWAELAFAWFEGGNVAGQPLVDPKTGGCHDGLEPYGLNPNQGAESLLAWLLACEDMAQIAWG